MNGTLHITRKDALSMFDKVYRVGYCDLADVVSNRDRVGYNSGLYGWNWDLIPIGNPQDNCAISTGYRSMVGDSLPQWFRDAYFTLKKERDDWYSDGQRHAQMTQDEYDAERRHQQDLLEQMRDLVLKLAKWEGE